MIRDLLNPSSGILDLREDSKGGIQVAGLTELKARSTDEVSCVNAYISVSNNRPKAGSYVKYRSLTTVSCAQQVCHSDRVFVRLGTSCI